MPGTDTAAAAADADNNDDNERCNKTNEVSYSALNLSGALKCAYVIRDALLDIFIIALEVFSML